MQELPIIPKRKPPTDIEKEYVSYGMDFFFTNIPIKKIIDYILADFMNTKN